MMRHLILVTLYKELLKKFFSLQMDMYGWIRSAQVGFRHVSRATPAVNAAAPIILLLTLSLHSKVFKQRRAAAATSFLCP